MIQPDGSSRSPRSCRSYSGVDGALSPGTGGTQVVGVRRAASQKSGNPGHATAANTASRRWEVPMRVQFQSDGGLAVFPGLQTPISIDIEVLPASDANRLHQLVGATRFFDLPAHIG